MSQENYSDLCRDFIYVTKTFMLYFHNNKLITNDQYFRQTGVKQRICLVAQNFRYYK